MMIITMTHMGGGSVWHSHSVASNTLVWVARSMKAKWLARLMLSPSSPVVAAATCLVLCSGSALPMLVWPLVASVMLLSSSRWSIIASLKATCLYSPFSWIHLQEVAHLARSGDLPPVSPYLSEGVVGVPGGERDEDLVVLLPVLVILVPLLPELGGPNDIIQLYM